MPLESAGQVPALSRTAPAGSRGDRGRTLLPRSVVAREFSRLFVAHEIAAHPVEVRRLASRFVAVGHSDLSEVERYVLAYADPTGEKAARNVDRERGGRRG